MREGKFIVIDGTDGSGKATQTKLLVSKLRKNKFKVKTIDFPRYYDNFFGKFIGECLAGEYGDFLALNPRIASIVYAADRFESSKGIKQWLASGNIVIADRYASSNQIHQGGKIQDEKERKKFQKWLEEMEFGVFAIPKPDAIIYLDVPVEITQKLLAGEDGSYKKRYLKGRKDAAENDVAHLQDAKDSAIKMIKKNNNWQKIICVKNGQLMSIGEIGDAIWNKVEKIVK
ncbi:MAG: thymidylate kinase [Candidatus Moranbacteria bacterium]|nr:deoxynucleoside kinase [bacterium]MDP1834255.1 deoxynucleoside kinase [Candidatus Moranbacteria bacterium]MDZ4385193.1 thymidylate kinase [Candidatus Moranbacteria bacterium]